MSRTSLVHPSTSKLGPEDQAKGVYVYTPPLVLAYMNGEQLSSADMFEVREHFETQGLALPVIERMPESGPALADVFQDNVSGCQRTADEIPRTVGMSPAFAAPYGKKVVRKAVSKETPPRKPLEEIVAVAVSCYTPLQKEALFNQLAAELGYSVE